MQLTAQECEEKIQDLNNQIQRLIGYKQALVEMEEKEETNFQAEQEAKMNPA